MFYKIFTNLCNEKGISPTATLQKLNISTSKLTAWKKGSTPSAQVLILLSEFFEVSIDYLLKGDKVINNKIPVITNELKEGNKFSNNEEELLEIFQNFSDREQVKIIGRMEEWLEVKRQREAISQKQQIVGVQVARRTDGKFVKEPVTAEEMEKIKALPEDTDY